jgi:hypothetical protein
VGRVAFRRGTEDAHAGRPPDFDGLDDDYFAYERGRQFAVLCRLYGYDIPPNRIGRCVNPEAVRLLDFFGDDIR